MDLVRQQYRAHLDKARNGRITPEKWFTEWQMIFGRAQAFGVPEVQGEMAVKDFLGAVSEKIAPEWATYMKSNLITDSALDRPQMSMEDVAKVFSAVLQDQSYHPKKSKTAGVLATFGGSGSSTKEKHPCPCRNDYKGKMNKHSWKPEDCSKLRLALTGSAFEERPVRPISDADIKKIDERIKSNKWKAVRDRLTKAGWPINNHKKSKDTPDYSGTVQAALIDPSSFESMGIYSTIDMVHPLSASTILNSGGAVHLVNDRSLLLPNTFKRVTTDCLIDAGTQSLPVSGTGDRLIKQVLHGKKGPRTEDLLLKDVRVVEGFHVNIVSEALLRSSGIWYLGLDSTLRYGSMDRNVVLTKLEKHHNLLFIEYKKVTVYPLIMSAVL